MGLDKARYWAYLLAWGCRAGESGLRGIAPSETVKGPASMASFDEWRQKEAGKETPLWQCALHALQETLNPQDSEAMNRDEGILLKPSCQLGPPTRGLIDSGECARSRARPRYTLSLLRRRSPPHCPRVSTIGCPLTDGDLDAGSIIIT